MVEEKKVFPMGSIRRSKFTRYDKVDLSPECFPTPVFNKKQFMCPETNEVVEYWRAPLVHKTRNARGVLVKDTKFLVEGPILTSNGGIQIQKQIRIQKQRYHHTASCAVQHDISNEDIRKFCGIPFPVTHQFDSLPEKSIDSMAGKDSVGFLTELYYRCLYYVWAQKRDPPILCRKFEALEGIFSHPLKYQFNSQGEVDETHNPFKWYRIFIQGSLSSPDHSKATFIMATKNTKRGQMILPWARLQDVELKFRPVIEFTDITCRNGGFRINCRIVNAVVYGFTKISMICRQEAALAEVRADDALMDELQNDLEDSMELDDTSCVKIREGDHVITLSDASVCSSSSSSSSFSSSNSSSIQEELFLSRKLPSSIRKEFPPHEKTLLKKSKTPIRNEKNTYTEGEDHYDRLE